MTRIVCLVAVLGFSLSLAAEDSLAAEEQPGSPITLNHVAISVEDLDRSAAFYRTAFGLSEIVNRTEIPGIRWFSLGEGKELHLISVVKEPVTLNKAVHFALTTTDFDGLIDTLRRSGIEFSDFAGNAGEISIRADDTRQVYLQDPDGYWIEVNSTASD